MAKVDTAQSAMQSMVRQPTEKPVRRDPLPGVARAARNAGDVSRPTFRTTAVVCTRRDELAEFVGRWQDLADDAATPNVFLEPWQFLPAVEVYEREKQSIFVFLLQGRLDSQAEDRLIGFFPMETNCADSALRGSVLSSWRHRNLLLGTPLLRRGFEEAAWGGFFDWARRSPYGNLVLEFSRLLAEGPSYWALIDHLHKRVVINMVIESYTRAQLERDAGNAHGPMDGLSAGARKELRRQYRRLSELGALDTRVLRHDENPGPWIDQFLSLEASGWKREAGSAFLCQDRTEGYFRSICDAGHKRGQLQMLGYFLDDRPIALKCNFVARDTGFTMKIAYDEAYKAYSPGVLLELELMERFRSDSSLVRLDSCAIPEHFMINRLWKQRRPIIDLAISTGALRPNLWIGAYSFMRSVKRSVRSR